jgi:hypothetical protein
MFCRKNLRKQTLFLKSGAKVQKYFDICKFWGAKKYKKQQKVA